MNALVMYDHQTDTLWSQFLGQGVKGSLAGTRLEHEASQVTTWRLWKEQYPDTLALDKGNSSSTDPYASYYLSNRAGILGESRTDDRLSPKEFVVGVTGGTVQKAYPFRYLRNMPVLNDTVEGRSLVVVFDPEIDMALVFDTTLDGASLTFGPTEDPLLMRDQQTGTTWVKATGEAASGPLMGTSLEQIPTFASFWFAWSDFYPQTELYTG